MHLAPLIQDLAVILAVAGLVTLIFMRIKQPVVLGYIVAGIIIGPFTPPFLLISDLPSVKTWAEIGVIFLMFSLGLEFSFQKLARVGVAAGLTAMVEFVVMLGLGFGVGKMLSWSAVDAVLLGAMLSMSSTTIIIKALDELGLKTKRFAELVFGILIVEDLVAILILVALTTLVASGGVSVLALATSAGKLFLVVGAWFLSGYFVVPRFIRYVGKFNSNEMLLILSLGLCLALVVLAVRFNYSVALGAFIMGSILSESTESRRIEDLTNPLRDLFAAIFFVSVGMLMDPKALWVHKGSVLLITVITIVGKILSTSLGALASGQTLRSSILVGFSLAQIGEFSFIIAALGLSLGVMSDFLYPIAVAVSVVTTFTTPYLIRVAPRVADLAEQRLPKRVQDAIAKHVAWREVRGARGAQSPEFRRRAIQWTLCWLAVTIIGVGVSQVFVPWLMPRLKDSALVLSISWGIALILSAPFLWAMIFAFKGYASSDQTNITPALAQILTFLWLAVLSLAFFPAKYVGVVSAVLGIVLFTRLIRQVERSYGWFEEGFLSAFSEKGKTAHPQEIYEQLAPWDRHLVRVKVHPDAEFSGRQIRDTELRKKYGVSVVAIQRGSKTLVAPKPTEQIFPRDELLVLGTDAQIEAVRKRIEKPPGTIEPGPAIHGYEMRRVFITHESPFMGRSIRQSEIREKYSAMVVGIERRGRRITNPESDMVIEIEDTLWIVGESSQLDQLMEKALG